jgi:hypothetical protein
MRALMLVPALGLLAACDEMMMPPTPVVATCDEAALSAQWLGQTGAAARAATFAQPVRVFNRGDALTMDFNPNRVNIELDPTTDRVVRVFCG